MSTILKALRRLEEDSETGTGRSGADSAPAAGPRAADELRDRILAEESAAEVIAAADHDSNSTKRVAVAVSLLILGLGLGVGAYQMLSRDDSDPAVIVAAVSPPADTVLEPEPTDPRVGMPLADVGSAGEAVAASDAAKVSQVANVISLPPETGRPAESPNLSVGVEASLNTNTNTIPASTEVAEERALASANSTPTVERERPRPTLTPPTPSKRDTPELALAETSLAATPQRNRSESTGVANPPAAQDLRAKSTPSASAPRRSDDSRRRSPPDQVERLDRRGLPDITVLRTAWHPSADRRSVKLRLEATDEILTLREGDAVGGLVIQKISPSSVLFKAGDVEIRRRVGQP